ncbi:MAG: hypothetical protein AAGU74_08125 [Bacillota bacterium]
MKNDKYSAIIKAKPKRERFYGTALGNHLRSAAFIGGAVPCVFKRLLQNAAAVQPENDLTILR